MLLIDYLFTGITYFFLNLLYHYSVAVGDRNRRMFDVGGRGGVHCSKFCSISWFSPSGNKTKCLQEVPVRNLIYTDSGIKWMSVVCGLVRDLYKGCIFLTPSIDFCLISSTAESIWQSHWVSTATTHTSIKGQEHKPNRKSSLFWGFKNQNMTKCYW